MSAKVLWYAIVSSLAAILFGYDTAVISGAISSITQGFQLDPKGTGWAVSSALLGCVIGAAFSGMVSDKIGRKHTLIITAVCYFLSAIGSALAWNFTSFWMLRALGGVGIGFSAIVPMYIGEISPEEHRGKLASLYQLAITLGILIVYFVNYMISQNAPDAWMQEIGWRYMIGSETIPAIFFLLLIFTIPESPRWLLAQGREEEAERVCRLVISEKRVTSSLNDIRKTINEDKKSSLNLRSPGVLALIATAIGIAALQQLVGINVIIYYGTSFMSQVGIGGENGAFIQSVMIGVVNFLSTFLGIAIIDKYGRKPLLTGGAIGVAICILLVGVSLLIGSSGPWLIVPILLYIVFFAAGLGPLPWVVLGELAPSIIRAKILSIGILSLWAANIFVSQTFPEINDSAVNQNSFNASLPFFIYGFFAIVFIWFAVKILPETKGVSLEELSRRFRVQHSEQQARKKDKS